LSVLAVNESKLIAQFLENRKNGDKSDRFVLRNKGLQLVKASDLTFGERFCAKLGFGEASFHKIVDYVNVNRARFFSSNEPKEFNGIIKKYNQWRVCWKSARKIGKN
jgi:hypothetical protein